MQFTTLNFIFFGFFVLVLYYLIPRKFQWILLLTASYVFYLSAGVQYLAFILFTTLSVYTAACVIDNRQKKADLYLKEHKEVLTRDDRKNLKNKAKKENCLYLTVCIVVNFLILVVCKCSLVEPFRSTLREGSLSFLSLGLPLGISFYMFQSVGYLIDVYRGKATAERNLFKLALFVSFFPQLIQGPISKFSQLAPALYAPHDYDKKQVSFGLQRILWGYFKKLVVADRIAAAVTALRGPEYGGTGFVLLSIFYAIQIYCDFTGGIDIAIGLGEAMGIHMPENFQRPYFSKNIAEYWRRWHITLGEWMKDYIFYPVSVSQPMLRLSRICRKKLGSVGKRVPVYIASTITWLVTGIWHGITPNFLLWGMMNCFVIVVSEELHPLYERFHNHFHWKQKDWYGVFEILRMFMLMNLIRVCDLFPHVPDYFHRIGSLFTAANFHILWDGTMLNLGLSALDYGIIGCSVIVIFLVSLIEEKKGSVRELLWKKPALRYILCYLLLIVVLLMGSYGIGYNAGSFIYNQF